MATIGLMSQHPGTFANHKHYYVQQQPHSPPQQHYTAPPPPPQQSQPQHPHMQPPPHYYHSAPTSSFASSPSTSSYSHPTTSTAAFFIPPNKPYDGSGPHHHPQPPPPSHYYNQAPMQHMPVQAAAATASSPSTGPSSHPPPPSSSSGPTPAVAASSSPALPHMVQVNGSQYVLSPVQPTSTPYPVMLIPVASNSQQHDSSSSSGGLSDDERKARHIKTPQQMRVLKGAYTANPKPGKDEMKVLMKETKCSYNEVCRWFRNERHKEKKIRDSIRDGRATVDGKEGTAATPSEAATDSSVTNGGSTADMRPAAASVDSTPHSPSSSMPSTPASSQPSSPLSSVGSAADGDLRLTAWLHVFTSEFTSEQQQAAMRELISRTRTLAESGKELENLLNGKRARETDSGVKGEVVGPVEGEDNGHKAKKRRKVDPEAKLQSCTNIVS